MNWDCPYCTTSHIVKENQCTIKQLISTSEKPENIKGFYASFIRCLKCQQYTIIAELHSTVGSGIDRSFFKKLNSWQLMPESKAKPFPKYIPQALIEDYKEACSIVHLSPKAAATLARRCLQGTIRNFCSITGKTLYSEIEILKELVQNGNAPQFVNMDIVHAFDAVRKIGNIGAHMEQDINMIVEVEQHEAELLIKLIEMLFKEWYIARHDRSLALSRIQKLAKDIDERKKESTTKADKEPPEVTLD